MRDTARRPRDEVNLTDCRRVRLDLEHTPLDVDELIELARRRVQRGFTQDECERFALGEGCAAQS